MSFDIDLAKRLRAFIKKEFRTQKDAAEFLGIQEPRLTKMLKGDMGIGMDVIIKLVNDRNMNSNWFLTGTLPMSFRDKPHKTTVSDLSELKAGLDHIKKQFDYFTRTQRGVIDRLEQFQKEIDDLKEDNKTLNDKLRAVTR